MKQAEKQSATDSTSTLLVPDTAGTQSGQRFSTTSRLYDTLAEVRYISHNATDITIKLHMKETDQI